MQSLTIFFAAALLEIAGCFAVWGWWRLDKSALWLIPAVVLLSGFAWLLTLVDVEQAGRDRGEPQPLPDGLPRDEETRRDVFFGQTCLDQRAESAELIERVKSDAHDVFGQ